MSSSDRRGALGGLIAFAALPGLAMPVRAIAAGREVRFPTEPLVLRRMLLRELGGGASIRVVREWKCTFLHQNSAARVSAMQIDCEVTAPEQLAAFAKMERERVVTGLFPMTLQTDGMIADWPDARPVGITKAIDSAAQRLDAVALPAGEKDAAKRYFAEIGRTAAEFVSQVPRDLFFPETGRRSKMRELELPNGESGRYELTVEAEADGGSGLLLRSERRIVTRVGESSRTSLERWSISA